MNLEAHLKLEAAGFMGPMTGARAALGGLKDHLSGLLGPLAAVTAGIAGVATIGELFEKSIQAASSDESLTAKLTVLTKSVKDTKIVACCRLPAGPEPMRAEIELPGNFRAVLDEAGEWTCDEPACLGLLRTIAEEFAGVGYLPDPYGERLRGTLAAIPGAKL